MPVDPDKLVEWMDLDAPYMEGPRLTLVTPEGRVITGKQSTLLVPGATRVEGYMPHWENCPRAKEFKKKA